MFERLDSRSPTPLYAQISSRIRVAIASGELCPADGLPSVQQLAAQLRINPATVVQAYRELEADGLVATRHGAGTFVRDVPSTKRESDRINEAKRLVREMMADASRLGIPAQDLRAAIESELAGGDD